MFPPTPCSRKIVSVSFVVLIVSFAAAVRSCWGKVGFGCTAGFVLAGACAALAL